MRGSGRRPWRNAGSFGCTSPLTKRVGVNELRCAGPIVKAERYTAATNTQFRVDDNRL